MAYHHQAGLRFPTSTVSTDLPAFCILQLDYKPSIHPRQTFLHLKMQILARKGKKKRKEFQVQCKGTNTLLILHPLIFFYQICLP